MEPTILVADDDASIRLIMSQTLLQEGYKVRATDSPDALLKWIKAGEGDVVVTDVYMGDVSIFDRLPDMKRMRPELPVIVISAQNTILTAASALEHGALDYLPKPFKIDELAGKVARALEKVPARDRAERSRRKSTNDAELPIMGRSPAMQAVYRNISRVMNSDYPVMLIGETGTGKARTARAIHDLGKRRELPFVQATEFLMGSDSSGGSVATRCEELLELAKGGSIFVEHAQTLSAAQQASLLVLSEAIEEVTEGPGHAPRLIVSWQGRDRHAVIPEGFREDLFFRLNVLPIRLPSLRDRREDIPELSAAFLEAEAGERARSPTLDASAIGVLSAHDWPGNVRELKNVVARLAVFSPHDVIGGQDVMAVMDSSPVSQSEKSGSLEDEFSTSVERHVGPILASLGENEEGHVHGDVVQAVERPLISLALRITGGNKLRAAALLGMNRNTLRARIKALGLEEDED